MLDCIGSLSSFVLSDMVHSGSVWSSHGVSGLVLCCIALSCIVVCCAVLPHLLVSCLVLSRVHGYGLTCSGQVRSGLVWFCLSDMAWSGRVCPVLYLLLVLLLCIPSVLCLV